MPSVNADLLAGVVRSINSAISRLDCVRPFNPEEKAQHTKTNVTA
ncbi:hypothetical protein [Acinetobacter sp.]